MTDDLTITCMAGRSDAKKAYEQKIAQLKADRRELAKDVIEAFKVGFTYGHNQGISCGHPLGRKCNEEKELEDAMFDEPILQKAQQWAKE